MTKSSKHVSDAIIPVEAPTPASAALPVKRPYAVQVLGPVDQALQKAAALIRLYGYAPCSQTPTQIFGFTGTISITLVQGAVDEAYILAAEADIADAAAAEIAAYRRDVEAAAARQIAEAAKVAADAKRAALVAAQRAQIAALEREIAEIK